MEKVASDMQCGLSLRAAAAPGLDSDAKLKALELFCSPGILKHIPGK